MGLMGTDGHQRLIEREKPTTSCVLQFPDVVLDQLADLSSPPPDADQRKRSLQVSLYKLLVAQYSAARSDTGLLCHARPSVGSRTPTCQESTAGSSSSATRTC